MKGSEAFKQTIQKHLEVKAGHDELFAKTYAKESKNIDDCVTYILNTVQATKCNGFEDDEIFSMAIHYYDEDIPADKLKTAKMQSVVVNHEVELTPEEVEEEKKKAREKIFSETATAMKTKKKKSTPVADSSESKEEVKPQQTSMF